MDKYETIHKNIKYAKKLFLERVKKGKKCWYWKGAITSDKQGQIGLSFGTFKAHRLSYMMYIGRLEHGVKLYQTCNKKLCVNPRHQKIVISKAKLRKLAGPTDIYGSNNGNSKLKAKDIRKIRKMAEKKSYSEISQLYDVSAAQIGRIVRYKNWAHIK